MNAHSASKMNCKVEKLECASLLLSFKTQKPASVPKKIINTAFMIFSAVSMIFDAVAMNLSATFVLFFVVSLIIFVANAPHSVPDIFNNVILSAFVATDAAINMAILILSGADKRLSKSSTIRKGAHLCLNVYESGSA